MHKVCYHENRLPRGVVSRSRSTVGVNNELSLSLSGLNKADVLVALYNTSKPLGMGIRHFDPKPMLRAEAEELLKRVTYFDYLKGRVMKIDLSGDELDTWGYDRDNGQGAAERAITQLRG